MSVTRQIVPEIFLLNITVLSSANRGEKHNGPGTRSGIKHYVGRAGPDPGYVNLPPSTVGIGGPLISLKNNSPAAAQALDSLLAKAGRP